ncbi:DNA-binding domain-containing protein [Pseudomonas sp. Pseu.R1]|uniref:HvfC/BufC N-terminal domain-containing protein n=1 Tax=Pseudomonas sp. Pseu.R1 TaxID=3379818 RepID=UPI003B92CBF3
MTGSLASFQDAFVEALFHRPNAGHRDVFEQPGFAVYRNSVIKACLDALRANYPSTERLVGADWFTSAAYQYMRKELPADGRLIFYGDGFADFLANFEPAQELSYLPEVARLDRLWIESFSAQIQSPLEVSALATVPPEDLGNQVLQLRSSTRWQWFESQPIYTLWYHNRNDRTLPEPIEWRGEGALLIGDVDGVSSYPLCESETCFLYACSQQLSLDQACELVQRSHPTRDLNDLIGRLLAAQAFTNFHPLSRSV